MTASSPSQYDYQETIETQEHVDASMDPEVLWCGVNYGYVHRRVATSFAVIPLQLRLLGSESSNR